jgi:hypothetical protein
MYYSLNQALIQLVIGAVSSCFHSSLLRVTFPFLSGDTVWRETGLWTFQKKVVALKRDQLPDVYPLGCIYCNKIPQSEHRVLYWSIAQYYEYEY